MRKRAPDGTTLVLRAFRILRDVGSFDRHGLALQLGIHPEGAWSTMQALKRRGLATNRMLAKQYVVPYPREPSRMMARNYEWSVYSAVPGKPEPRDMRGRPKGSRNGTYANWIAAMHGKMGPDWRPKPKGVLALEEAWPIRR